VSASFRRFGSKRGAVLGAAALVSALGLGPRPPSGAQDAGDCAIAGRFVIPHVRLRTVDGERPRRPRFVDLDADAVLAPSIDGRHELSGTLADGHAFTARLRRLPALELARAVRLAGLVLDAGLRITDVHRDTPLGFDLELGPDVHLRDVPVPCADVAPAGERPREPTLTLAPPVGPARQPARTRLVLTDDRGATLARVSVAPAVVFTELDRRGDRVRVAWASDRARLDGWLEARDLVMVAPADRPRSPR
jgi:hypothetical protein